MPVGHPSFDNPYARTPSPPRHSPWIWTGGALTGAAAALTLAGAAHADPLADDQDTTYGFTTFESDLEFDDGSLSGFRDQGVLDSDDLVLHESYGTGLRFGDVGTEGVDTIAFDDNGGGLLQHGLTASNDLQTAHSSPELTIIEEPATIVNGPGVWAVPQGVATQLVDANAGTAPLTLADVTADLLVSPGTTATRSLDSTNVSPDLALPVPGDSTGTGTLLLASEKKDRWRKDGDENSRDWKEEGDEKSREWKDEGGKKSRDWEGERRRDRENRVQSSGAAMHQAGSAVGSMRSSGSTMGTAQEPRRRVPVRAVPEGGFLGVGVRSYSVTNAAGEVATYGADGKLHSGSASWPKQMSPSDLHSLSRAGSLLPGRGGSTSPALNPAR